MSTSIYDSELREAFDRWAPTYEADAIAKLNARGYSYGELGAGIADVITAAPATGSVLEVGTGTGVLGVEVARRVPGIELRGLDISPGMLAYARRKNAYTSLDLAAADRYDYRRGYRVIYSSFAFHSFDDQAGFLSRARAGLRPGGSLVIVDLFPATLDDTESGLEHSRRHEKGAPSNYLDVPSFQRLAANAGFALLESKPLGDEREYAHVWHAFTV